MKVWRIPLAGVLTLLCIASLIPAPVSDFSVRYTMRKELMLSLPLYIAMRVATLNERPSLKIVLWFALELVGFVLILAVYISALNMNIG